MSKNTVIVVTIAIAGVAIFYIYSRSKAQATSASSGSPINSLPGRQYSLTPFNANGQPLSPTFTAFSGVPFVEGLLTSFGGGQAQPSSGDSPNGVPIPTVNQVFGQGTVSVDDTSSGTSTYFG